MALRKSSVAIQFSGGIQTKTDSKQVQPVQLLDLQNAVFTKETTLSKRNGYRSLGLEIEGTGGSTIKNPVGLGKRSSETILFNGSKAYSKRSGVEKWSDTGEVVSTVMRDQVIARTGTVQKSPDHATSNGVTAIAWEDSRGGVWASLVDSETNKIVVQDTQLDSLGSRPRCISIGSRVLILYAVPSSLRIYAIVVDPINISGMPSPIILVDNLSSSNPSYDAIFASSDSPDYSVSAGLIAWSVNGGGFQIGYILESGSIGSVLTGTPSSVAFPSAAVTGPVAVSLDPGTQLSISVIYQTTGNALQLQLITPSTLAGSSSISVLSGSASSINRVSLSYVTTDTSPIVCWAAEINGSRPDTCLVRTGSVRDGLPGSTIVLDGSARALLGHQIASRAFSDSTSSWLDTDADRQVNAYINVVHAVQFFQYVATVRISGEVWGGRTVAAARFLPGQSSGALASSMLPSMQPVNPDAIGWSRQFKCSFGYKIALGVDDTQTSDTNFSEVGIKNVSLDFDSDDSYQTAELGLGMYMAGGLMQHYDGSRWAEATFHCAPDYSSAGFFGSPIISATSDVSGALSQGTYNYVSLYEEIDNSGEIHPGSVSVPLQVVIGPGQNAVNFSIIPTCRLTQKKNVRITVWRSPVNQTGSPSQIPYYRVSGLDPTIITGPNRYISNDTTVDSVSLLDVVSDVNLIKREPLYTNGGILSNDPASCAGGPIVSGKNRLFYLDPSDPNIVRFTQQIREDTGVEEAPSLVVRCDPYGGGSLEYQSSMKS